MIKSTNEHGVHSPFIYDLVTKCFYDKTNFKEYELLQKYRTDLLKNDTEIAVSDFGAGSRVFTNNNRKVSEMAKVAGASIADSKLLFRIIRYLKPQEILEFGTSLAISTYTFANASDSSKICTIEGSKGIFDWNNENSKNYNFRNTKFLNNLFDDFLLGIPKEKKYDLIYIDGNHQYSATIKYFNFLKNHISNDSVMIFDDIHWSEGMEKAWNEIKNDNDVSVSIDTFNFGMIFFRNEQRKEHFIIRT